MANGTITGTTSLHSGDYTFWIEWSSSVSEQGKIDNESVVKATAYVRSNGGWASDTVNSGWTQTITINGSKASREIQVNIKKDKVKVLLISHTVTVPHNADGSKTITISAKCGLGSASYSPGTGTASKSVTLDKIDRTAPSVTVSTSSITTTSVVVSATANASCNLWYYSINDGGSWTQYSTVSGTTSSKTITGLSPSTAYKIKVRARKASNHVTGTSAAKSVTTKEDTPGAPTSVTAKCGTDTSFTNGGNITLSWSGAKSPIQSYEVQCAVKAANSSAWGAWAALTTVTTTATSASCTDNFHASLSAGAQIKYRVRARNGTPVSAFVESNALTRLGGIRVNINGTWKIGTVWVNAAGVWKRAACVWRNNSGTWSRSR